MARFFASTPNTYGLKVLYEPAVPSNVVADIVFVHGLTGSWDDTWTAASSNKPWPEILLRLDIPDVRILSWGYDANVANFWNPTSKNRVSNHAQNLIGDLGRRRERTDSEHRPMIFVVHSLGGLVVEEALYLSWNSPEPDLRLVAQSAIAIAFLGTPHHGSNKAAWASSGARLTKAVAGSNQEIVDLLQPGSEMLASIQDRFHANLRLRRNQQNELAITCFYEELDFPGIGEVVPYHSAILPGYRNEGIHANHVTMTKFSSREDNNYDRVVGELLRWVKPLRVPTNHRTPSPLTTPMSQGYQQPPSRPGPPPLPPRQRPSYQSLPPSNSTQYLQPYMNTTASHRPSSPFDFIPQDNPLRPALEQSYEQSQRDAVAQMNRQVEARRNGTPEYLSYFAENDPMRAVIQQSYEQSQRDIVAQMTRQVEARRNGTPEYLSYFDENDPMRAIIQQSYEQSQRDIAVQMARQVEARRNGTSEFQAYLP